VGVARTALVAVGAAVSGAGLSIDGLEKKRLGAVEDHPGSGRQRRSAGRPGSEEMTVRRTPRLPTVIEAKGGAHAG